jgi:hypothetical protein
MAQIDNLKGKIFTAPKGNKFAAGSGRPPMQFSEEYILEIGQDFLEWMKECDKDPSFIIANFSQFYSEIKGLCPKQWAIITLRESFLSIYARGKAWMHKRIVQNKAFPSVYGSRYLSMYDSTLLEHEEAIADREAARRTKQEIEQQQNLAEMVVEYQKKYNIQKPT